MPCAVVGPVRRRVSGTDRALSRADHAPRVALHETAGALRKLDLVNFVVIYVAKLLVSVLFVPVVDGLNWRRATRSGALSGMTGVAACLTWGALGHPRFVGLDPAEAGMLASALLFVGVSLVTPPMSDDVLRSFFPGSRRVTPPSHD